MTRPRPGAGCDVGIQLKVGQSLARSIGTSALRGRLSEWDGRHKDDAEDGRSRSRCESLHGKPPVVVLGLHTDDPVVCCGPYRSGAEDSPCAFIDTVSQTQWATPQVDPGLSGAAE